MTAHFSRVECSLGERSTHSQARLMNNDEVVGRGYATMPDIYTLYLDREAARSRYDEAKQADRDTPYHDSRNSSREAVEAHWQALQAITEYKQSLRQIQEQWLFLSVLCAMYGNEESEHAA